VGVCRADAACPVIGANRRTQRLVRHGLELVWLRRESRAYRNNLQKESTYRSQDPVDPARAAHCRQSRTGRQHVRVARSVLEPSHEHAQPLCCDHRRAGAALGDATCRARRIGQALAGAPEGLNALKRLCRLNNK
jgi:hypothetical protein